MKRTIFLFTLLFVTSLAISFADETPVAADYETQMLTVWGMGGTPWEETVSLEEERARAWMDALHHGYEQALGMHLMEGVTVKSALQANPVLRERLGHLMLNCRKTFFQPDVSGLMRCRLDVPFSGVNSLRSALFLAALRPSKAEPFQPPEATATPEIRVASEAGTLPWKRLVIDVRRQFFQPSLFPRFYAVDGKLLFQEARIPGPKRFSRPAVRFSRSMTAAEKDLLPMEVLYVAAVVSPLATRDLRILGPDADIFHRFCRRLEAEPEKSGEILIIFSDRPLGSGILSKTKSKTKTKEEKTPAPRGLTPLPGNAP